MATASRESRSRPPIQPIRTTGPGHSDQAVRARMAFKSPAWMSTPLSPLCRPSPMYPDSDDDRMREHDKAAVDRLDPRSRKSSSAEPSPRNLSLKPTSDLALPTPLSLDARRSPLSGPITGPLTPSPSYRRMTIAEETRKFLLREPRTEINWPLPRAIERRGSAPSTASLSRNIQFQRQLGQLGRPGSIDSRHSREPDLYVMPVELRRLSTIATPTKDGAMPSPFPVDGRLTTRVVIHSPNQKPRALTRTFDLDELRATIPNPGSVPGCQGSRRASTATLHPSTAVARPVFPFSSANRRERRHSSAGTTGISPHRSPGLERRATRQALAAIPIHLEYARLYLPVLAAIILSAIVQPGDTLELPLPYPQVWDETMAYIYTGQVALTHRVRQNIMYMGGMI
ncbi:hypothetical protein B0J13DRAFT_228558 [Dactylonectria estremocensis]|uniref:Uncharacterized protein n=1 Tax=Dactylonectria estremocensis TaxID=1079267 RepID=A0A9P9F7I5_9HYPO|nr:hypothetical protein B0J13DRAFT_228558 [Dactylonectria estremocensis]